MSTSGAVSAAERDLVDDVGEVISDASLILAVREGDTQAYGTLFERHREAAERLSRQLVRGLGADDLVSEAFLKVLGVLQRGGGPDVAFRAYLLTAVRRLHIDAIRSGRRERPTDDEADLDRRVEFIDPAEMKFERGAAGEAFSSLPERWQLVLWHLDVEGQTPAEIAPLLGMAPNSVSALAYRAREGLRRAYLQQHLAPTLEPACRATTGLLGAHVRQGLSARDTRKVEDHLDTCARCTGLFLELREVNSNLAGILGPALLGTAATGYLGATATLSTIGLVGAGTTAGVVFTTQAVLTESARGAVAGVVTSSAPAAVASVAIAGAATVGVVATTSHLAAAPPPPSIEAIEDVPAYDPADDGIRLTEPAPEPTVTLEPAPEPSPTGEPVPAAEPEPAPEATPEPTPSPDPEPAPDPTATPEPEPAPPPVVGTDFTFGLASVVNVTLLERSISIPVTGVTTGGVPADRAVTVDVRFTRHVLFKSVGEGWDCSVAAGAFTPSFTCTTTIPAGGSAQLQLSVLGIRPSGTVTLRADQDPDTTNDSTSFSSPGLLLLF